MKISIVTILFVIIQTLPTFSGDTFDRISNKTWFQENGFAGTSVVFYMTNNSLPKAIRQINGSGVPVVSSEIYDIAIRQDTIYLFNGINLKTSEKLVDLNYTFDKTKEILLANGKPLRIILDKPILFAWTDKRKSVTTQIDMNMLTKISLKKNEIYKDEDISQILIDK